MHEMPVKNSIIFRFAYVIFFRKTIFFRKKTFLIYLIIFFEPSNFRPNTQPGGFYATESTQPGGFYPSTQPGENVGSTGSLRLGCFT